MCRKVICVETGVVYNSITEAAKAHNVTVQEIFYTLRGAKPTAAGCRWKYADDNERTDYEKTVMIKDGVMPMDDEYSIVREQWVKNPIYTLYKHRIPVEHYDCLKSAMATYRYLKRHSIKTDDTAVRRLKSYANEWESPRG